MHAKIPINGIYIYKHGNTLLSHPWLSLIPCFVSILKQWFECEWRSKCYLLRREKHSSVIDNDRRNFSGFWQHCIIDHASQFSDVSTQWKCFISLCKESHFNLDGRKKNWVVKIIYVGLRDLSYKDNIKEMICLTEKRAQEILQMFDRLIKCDCVWKGSINSGMFYTGLQS